MSYLITGEDGYAAAQHHDASWPEDKRLTTRCVRVGGRDPNTLDLLIYDGPGGNVPNFPNTVGYETDRAVWLVSDQPDPSGTLRQTPLWGNAFPAVSVSVSGTTSDPYRSEVVSTTLALPAFDQDPADPTAWRGDTGLLPQKVAIFGGQAIPGGTSLIVLPFSVQTEQQMAAFKASSELVAVWRGGAAEGPLGTLEYDVDAQGNLDKLRRARRQSFDRVYRLPRTGLLPFGADPNADQKPFPVSSGLAWQQGLDIDSQAGYGMIVDTIASAAPQPTKNSQATGNQAIQPTATFDPNTGMPVSFTPGSVTAPVPPTVTYDAGGNAIFTPTFTGAAYGAAGQTVSPPSPAAATGAVPQTTERTGSTPQTTGTVVIFAVTGKKGYGGHSVGTVDDKHHIADTPEGEQVNTAHWNVQQPIDGDGFDAPAETSGVFKPTTRGGPLRVLVEWAYDQQSVHPYLDGTREGLRRWEAPSLWDTPPPKEKTGPSDKTGSTDKNPPLDKAGADKATSDKNPDEDKAKQDKSVQDGQPQKPINDPADSNGYMKPGGWDSGATKGSHFAVDVKQLQDDAKVRETKIPKDYSGGLPGLAKLAADFVAPRVATGIGSPKASVALPLTFGSMVLLGPSAQGAQNQVALSTATAVETNRSYARTPVEVAAPGFLARPTSLLGSDLRGRTEGLTAAQQAAYDSPVPIAGVMSAVGDQSTGSHAYFANGVPGSGLYLGGSSAHGGFALHPSNTDIRSIQLGQAMPPSMPTTTFFAATLSSQIALADPGLNALPVNGFWFVRTPTTVLTLNWAPASGIAMSPAPLVVDANAQTVSVFGTVIGSASPWDRVGTVVQLHTATDSVSIQSGKITSPGTGGTGNEQFGSGAAVTGDQGTAVGASAIISASGCTSVGNSSSTSAVRSTAVGKSANASGADSTALGQGTGATQSKAVSVGSGAQATSTSAISIGSSTVGAINSIGIGTGITALTGSDSDAVVIGTNAQTGVQSVVIGSGAFAGSGKTSNVVVGYLSHTVGVPATTTSTQATVIGTASQADSNSVSVGYQVTTNQQATAVGARSLARDNGVAIGYSAFAGVGGNVTIGRDCTLFGPTQTFAAGSDTYPLTSIYFGKGGNSGTPVVTTVPYTIHNTDSSGADTVGAAIGITPGLATGRADSGHFVVQIGQPGASGTTLQTPSTVFEVNASGATVTGKLTVTGVIYPTQVLLSGTDKRFGATDAGAVYLAPFADQVAAVEIREADNVFAVFSVDTLNERVGINTSSPGFALDVNGDVHVSGSLIVDGLSAPVFEVAFPGSGVAQLGMDCPALNPEKAEWVSVLLADGRRAFMSVWV